MNMPARDNARMAYRDSTASGPVTVAGDRAASAPPPAPHAYTRRVLLAVTGLSPQVVTETLYALTQQCMPAFVPTEIRILSTSAGAALARERLLDESRGQFFQLCRDYGLDSGGIDFSPAHIETLKDSTGAPLDDIDSAAANTAVADAITAAVRALTADDDCSLHASIAGGRKTMGFYLGYALSLYGRPQDRLSHVLVSAPFESDHQFYYPPANDRVLAIKGQQVHTAAARVTLAEIPFVRLRHALDERLANGPASYSEAVAAAQAAVDPPVLTLDLAAGRVCAAGKTFRLAPAALALLALFARRAQAQADALPAPAKGVPDPEWATRFLTEYRRLRGSMADTDRTEKALAKGMDGEHFSAQLSKLRRALRHALGPAAAPYLIDDGGRRPHKYRLALPPEAVRFASLGEDELVSSAPGTGPFDRVMKE